MIVFYQKVKIHSSKWLEKTLVNSFSLPALDVSFSSLSSDCLILLCELIMIGLKYFGSFADWFVECEMFVDVIENRVKLFCMTFSGPSTNGLLDRLGRRDEREGLL